MADPRISEFTKTLEKNPASTAFARLADIYRKSGETNKAIEICQEGIGRNPSYITGHLILGRCYLERGITDKAQESFEQALHLDPRNFLALKMLGDILISQGRKKEGVQRYAQILALDPLDSSIHELYERYNGYDLFGDPAQIGSVSQQVEAAMSQAAPSQSAASGGLQDVFPTDTAGQGDLETADVLDQLTSETTADASRMEEATPKPQVQKPQSQVNELGEEELIIPDSVPLEGALDEVIFDLAPRKQALPLATLGDDVEELLLESFLTSSETQKPSIAPPSPVAQPAQSEELIPADNAAVLQEPVQAQGPSLAETLENMALPAEEEGSPEPAALEPATERPEASDANAQEGGSSIPEWAQTETQESEAESESINIEAPPEEKADSALPGPAQAESLSAPAIEEPGPDESVSLEKPSGGGAEEIGTGSASLPEIAAAQDALGEPAPDAEVPLSPALAEDVTVEKVEEVHATDKEINEEEIVLGGSIKQQESTDDQSQIIADAAATNEIPSEEILTGESGTPEAVEHELWDLHESTGAGEPQNEDLPKQPEIGQEEAPAAGTDLIADDRPIEDDSEAKDDAPVSEFYNVAGGSAEAEAIDSSALEGIDNVEIAGSLAEDATEEENENNAPQAQSNQQEESIEGANETQIVATQEETSVPLAESDNAPTSRIEDLVSEQHEGTLPGQESDDGPVSEFYNVTGGSAESDSVDSEDLEGMDRVTLDESLDAGEAESPEEGSPESEEKVAPTAAEVPRRSPEAKPERSRIDLPEGVASATLAELFLHQGQRDQAIEVYRYLLSRDPSNFRLASRLREIEMGTARAEPGPEPVRPKRTQPRKETNRRRRRPKADAGPSDPLEDL